MSRAACLAAWPEAWPSGYDPRCCRFPKSCSIDPEEDTVANPGAKQFQQVHITIDVWVDPETSDSSAWAVAENVEISAKNAIEAEMKAIEAPDHGIEVVVR